MKKNTFRLLPLFLVLLTINTFGQLKAISEGQFSAFTSIIKKSNSLPHIRTTISKSFKDGKLVKTRKDVYELESPYRTKQTFYEFINDEYLRTSEYIRLADTQYKREKQNEWREFKVPKGGIPAPIGAMNTPRLDQYAAGISTLEGKSLRHFSRYQILYFNNKLSFFDSRYWVSDEGNIVKKMTKISSMFPENVSIIYESTYTYDKNIKISAPKSEIDK